jgi:hypothetical protein
MLRGRWCHTIVLNVHAPTEDKIDYVKGSFYEKLDHVFNTFPKYLTKILLGDFDAKVDRKIFLVRQLRTKVYTKLLMTMGSEQ